MNIQKIFLLCVMAFTISNNGQDDFDQEGKMVHFEESYQPVYEEISDEDVPVEENGKQLVFERWSKASKDYSWVLEIKNDSKWPYFITYLSDGTETYRLGSSLITVPLSIGRAKGADQKDKGYLRLSVKDVSKTVPVLGINPGNEIKMRIAFKFKQDYEKEFEVVIKKNPKRKKVFLTIDEGSEFNKFKIRPQKGSGIIRPTSQSGVSLQGNVTASEIKITQVG